MITYEDLPEVLRKEVPGFDQVYDEHIRDYEEVLPHVLLGALLRFLESPPGGDRTVSLAATMAVLERALTGPDARIHEAITVSFLENMDSDDPSFEPIRSSFGPLLAANTGPTLTPSKGARWPLGC